MAVMVHVDHVRVFCDEEGRFGNSLGVVAHGHLVPKEQRRRFATTLGFSETVFIDEIETGRVAIFSPAGELPFAGHPLVGVAWFLTHQYGQTVDTLRPPAGPTPTWINEGRVWVRGNLGATPPWWHERLDSPQHVAELRGPVSPEQDATQLWAWEDQESGHIRARVFGSRFGIEEDEACGSASMRLAAALGRRLVINHGAGSQIIANPGPPGMAEVGGFVVPDDALDIPL
jgi:predicted PhzF superfamily epimerase YddE/YHI9